MEVELEKLTPNASEALYGFIGWLSTQPDRLEIGAGSECSIWAEKINQFIAMNDLPDMRENWARNIIHPSSRAGESGECR